MEEHARARLRAGVVGLGAVVLVTSGTYLWVRPPAVPARCGHDIWLSPNHAHPGDDVEVHFRQPPILTGAFVITEYDGNRLTDVSYSSYGGRWTPDADPDVRSYDGPEQTGTEELPLAVPQDAEPATYLIEAAVTLRDMSCALLTVES